jgi:hypothetical protein
MNREETKKCIAVMQAYVDGEPIEVLDKSGAVGKASDPIWDWENWSGSYRVKPKPKLRPWTAAEVVARMAERPLLVKHADANLETLAVLRVVIPPKRKPWVQLADGTSRGLDDLAKMVQHDGSPCGVVE